MDAVSPRSAAQTQSGGVHLTPAPAQRGCRLSPLPDFQNNTAYFPFFRAVSQSVPCSSAVSLPSGQLLRFRLPSGFLPSADLRIEASAAAVRLHRHAQTPEPVLSPLPPHTFCPDTGKVPGFPGGMPVSHGRPPYRVHCARYNSLTSDRRGQTDPAAPSGLSGQPGNLFCHSLNINLHISGTGAPRLPYSADSSCAPRFSRNKRLLPEYPAKYPAYKDP